MPLQPYQDGTARSAPGSAMSELMMPVMNGYPKPVESGEQFLADLAGYVTTAASRELAPDEPR